MNERGHNDLKIPELKMLQLVNNVLASYVCLGLPCLYDE